ncbi:MAG: UpxY family transcription antiterminator [Chitinophagaceae bacterium]|nr:UpxY family transcription antiterminator [Bacteroidota bacterium]MCC6256850.1 UpxY family transcription antiterminator [Chitinophagaceae bacterium]MCW5918147.1 UpxY family transcription antiterminator [Ferruginibacter sp.]
MHVKENELSWFVVYTKPRWEKKVARILTEKGVENYCPLNKVLRNWSDRKKVVLEPLFKGYVFLRTYSDSKWDIKKIDGILNYVYWLGKPAVVKDEEINTIRMFLREFQDVEVVENNLVADTPVMIRQGVLMKYKGVVIEVLGSKARVKIESMGVQLTAVFDKSNLQPLNGIV